MAPSLLRRITKAIKSADEGTADVLNSQKVKSKRFSFRPRVQDVAIPAAAEVPYQVEVKSPRLQSDSIKPKAPTNHIQEQGRSSDHGGQEADIVVVSCAKSSTGTNDIAIHDSGSTRQDIDEIIIAIMGMTGAGKSSFINTVSGVDATIGHSLYSETSATHTYRFVHKLRKYVLVDTPGFDDSSMSNDEVTQIVLHWLEASYREGRRINGIIYMHAITNPRMSGSAYNNIRMFKKLCGDDALKNVVLATSFWDQVDPVKGQSRETELTSDKRFWANMIAKGATTVRLRPDRDSCLGVIEAFADRAAVDLLIQNDLVNEGKDLQETTARLALLDPELIKVHKELQAQRSKEIHDIELKMEEQIQARRETLDKLKLEHAIRQEQEKERLQKLDDQVQKELRELRIHQAVEKQHVEAVQRQLEEERRDAELRQEESTKRVQKALEEHNRLRNQRQLAEQIRRGREREETSRLEKLQHETQERTKQRQERQRQVHAEVKEQQRLIAEHEKLETERRERQQAEEEIRSFERMGEEKAERERIEHERNQYQQWAGQQQPSWYGYPQSSYQQYPQQQQCPPQQPYPYAYPQTAHYYGCNCYQCMQRAGYYR